MLVWDGTTANPTTLCPESDLPVEVLLVWQRKPPVAGRQAQVAGPRSQIGRKGSRR